MTEATKRKDLDLDYFLHPARAFRTPMDVVTNPDMTVQEKRAVLASWASDAGTVEAAPDLRHRPSASIVRFDDIMEALKQLDGEGRQQTPVRQVPRPRTALEAVRDHSHEMRR